MKREDIYPLLRVVVVALANAREPYDVGDIAMLDRKDTDVQAVFMRFLSGRHAGCTAYVYPEEVEPYDG